MKKGRFFTTHQITKRMWCRVDSWKLYTDITVPTSLMRVFAWRETWIIFGVLDVMLLDVVQQAGCGIAVLCQPYETDQALVRLLLFCRIALAVLQLSVTQFGDKLRDFGVSVFRRNAVLTRCGLFLTSGRTAWASF
jgi:hypothetical protein